ncbi:3-keto-5-aminohexanoate cleavage protein [Streptomyces sp. NPDC046759]|uniref:3-keto-5-aminohexanoate cleavage protein n=1 Tax=Streptomyces sp. NPDC046759 TaxID=3155019 RepID=UPI0033C79150
MLAKPDYYRAYRDMVVEAGPEFYLEHLKRLHANGIQPHCQLAHLAQLETVERLIRSGVYAGPLVLNYVAVGGGFAGRHPADLVEFIRRVPDGAVFTPPDLEAPLPDRWPPPNWRPTAGLPCPERHCPDIALRHGRGPWRRSDRGAREAVERLVQPVDQ